MTQASSNCTNGLALHLTTSTGGLCAPSPMSQHIFKRLEVWSYCFVPFFYMYFSLRKVQFHQSALMYVATTTIELFGLILKTRISIVFQVHVFPAERNFLWVSLLCFGHHDTLRSLIKANIRTVTVETFQKSFCPNMVINTKTIDQCHVSSL